MERTFFFLGSALQVFGQCGGASIRTRFCENYFSGDLNFRKTETNLFLDFVRAEEGSGEESAWASAFVFGVGGQLRKLEYYKDFHFFKLKIILIFNRKIF